MSYFFIAVSTKENLRLCKKYALAGFPSTTNGLWAYVDIQVGDYISFLYGARAHNLYQVTKKEAIKDAKNMPPWKSLTFASGTTVDFPYRIYLKQVRAVDESIARPEFSFIAENLLLRGGYRKTHFQADQTTLQNVSQMGKMFEGKTPTLNMPPYRTFIPKFVRKRKSEAYHFQFKEVILQALIRQHLSERKNCKKFLRDLNLDQLADIEFEVLGEKAFPEGHVDLLVKETSPKGTSKQIVIEVKLNRASNDDLEQLSKYMSEIGEECVGGVLIAKYFARNILPGKNIHLTRYEFGGINLKQEATSFDRLLQSLVLSPRQ